MLDIRDRTVVITGGATGIGFGLAKAFGARGANVVIGEPRQARLDEAITKLNDSGIKACAIPMDVTDPEQLNDFAEQAFAAFGEVAVVVNNAGIGQARGSVTDTPVEDLQKVMAVNFEGV